MTGSSRNWGATILRGAAALCLAASLAGSRARAADAPLPPGVPADAMIATDITPGKKGGRLVIGQAGDPKTFNPIIEGDSSSSRVISFLQDALYGYDQFKQEDKPAMAKSWSFDEATMTWTFKLREGLKWSDGAPITADDFIFFVEAARDERVPSTLKEFFQIDGKPFEFTAPDPLTLVVKIPALDSFSILNLGLVKPLPRRKYEKSLKDGTFNNQMGTDSNPADLPCSGPFMLQEFKSGEKVVLKANPHYYQYDAKGTRLPYVNELVLLGVENADSLALRFQSGDTDLLEDLQINNLPILLEGEGKGNYTVVKAGMSVGSNHFWFNLKPGGSYEEGGKRIAWIPPSPGAEPPADIKAKGYRTYVDPVKQRWFENEDFRKACSMASNRNAIVKTILFGEGSPLYGPTSPGNKEWSEPDIPKFPYDIAKAKALLDKIGYVDRDKDGVREDDKGNPIRFTIISNKENNIREKVGVLLKEDLTKIGLGATVQMVDFNVLITRISDTHDYEGCLLGLTAGVPPHPAMGKSTWLSSGRMHQWNPDQPTPATPWEAEIDSLYAQMQRTFDRAEQRKLHGRMQQIYCEHAPMIHLFTPMIYVAASNKLGNLKPSVLTPYITHNLPELYIK